MSPLRGPGSQQHLWGGGLDRGGGGVGRREGAVCRDPLRVGPGVEQNRAGLRALALAAGAPGAPGTGGRGAGRGLAPDSDLKLSGSRPFPSSPAWMPHTERECQFTALSRAPFPSAPQ